jgi:C-terminal processing protease CtpA/Prc
MYRIFVTLLIALFLGPGAHAGEEELDQEIAEVRRSLDESARTLANLYRQRYSADEGKDRAMLGILLGDGAGEGGVELFGVTPGGGADQAGLAAGDLIVKLDDLSVSDAANPMRALSNYMKQVAPGDEIDVVYERKGQRNTATITTQAHSVHMLSMVQEKMAKLGDVLPIDVNSLMLMPAGGHESLVTKVVMSDDLIMVSGDLADYFEVDEGVLIVGPAENSALKGGDILLSVGDVPVSDLQTAYKLLGDIEEQASVKVKRRGNDMAVNVKTGELLASKTTTQTRVVRINAPDKDGKEVVVKIEVSED